MGKGSIRYINYKPNNIDPSRISLDPKQNVAAGVSINYGYQGLE